MTDRTHIRNHKVVNGIRTSEGPLFKKTRVEVDLTTPVRLRGQKIGTALHAALEKVTRAHIRPENRSSAATRTHSKRFQAGSRRNKKHPIARTPTLRDRGWELNWDV